MQLGYQLQAICNELKEIREIKVTLRQGLAEIRNTILLQSLNASRTQQEFEICDVADFVDGRLDPPEFFFFFYLRSHTF